MPEAKTGPVPALRFPEFRDAGPWEVKRLGEIADVVAAGDLDRNDFSAERTDSHRFPIFSNSVTDKGLYGFCSNPRYGKDSVTITARGTLGVAFHREICFSAIGRLLVISDLNSVDPYFFQENWNFAVNLPLEDGGIPQLPAVKVKAAKLALPSLPEQQKIADCLGSLDDLIRAEEGRLGALKDHKRGLMQRLFPRPNEATPRLRFPEFQNAGPWEVKRLGDYVEQKAGNSKLIKGKLYPEPGDGRFPGFSASGQDVWLDTYEQEGPAIIVSAVGARCGRCFFADGKWSAIANTHILFPQQGAIDIRFLFKAVTREGYWVISGSGQPFVKVRDSLLQKVPLPSLPEQQKIADCLTSLDDLIRAQGEAIAALKAHKTGLMQQLFPREVG